eukprot:7433750-Alexandrium_andersonii.AAC.1
MWGRSLAFADSEPRRRMVDALSELGPQASSGRVEGTIASFCRRVRLGTVVPAREQPIGAESSP